MEYSEDVNEFAPANPIDETKPVQVEGAEVEENASAAVETPQEPPKEPNGYESIILQQTEQINALIAQNQSLTDQITKLVQNGAQIANTQHANVDPLSQLSTPSLADGDDWSLEALAKDIGKRKR